MVVGTCPHPHTATRKAAAVMTRWIHTRAVTQILAVIAVILQTIEVSYYLPGLVILTINSAKNHETFGSKVGVYLFFFM